ncbi:nitroreductase [Erythrobacter sp. NE805]|uniref:nitroreductase n=1 Tax=Erythrobacter sp. NE805 TaxID=3389875 RepID=UPI00396AF753
MVGVSQAVQSRRSVRSFLPDPVPAGTLHEILELAQLAPSSSNMQPWRVFAVTGAPLADLLQRVRETAAANPRGEPPEYPIYAPDLKDPYNARRIACAEDLYGHIGVARENKLGRLMHFARNFAFFGAPVGLIVTIDRTMERGQWADVGIWLSTFMLLAQERGLSTCAQAAWAGMNRTVRSALAIPDEYLVYCGIALGYADPEAQINTLRIGREPIESAVTMIGFEEAAEAR